jgi:predicted ATPase/class 3 adenylate cyclase
VIVAGETELPVGLVTLLFSDIEGSTRLLHELGDVYGEVLADHRRLLREVWRTHGGVEVGTEGDAFFVAFADPGAAVGAATDAQRALAGHEWPRGGTVRVRMGVHTGRPKLRGGQYWGIDVHYAARVCAAANGGQVLLSESTAVLADVGVEDLGQHALKDFPAPRRLFHLLIDGRGSDCFAPPRTLRTGRTNLPDQLSSFVGRERELDEVGALLGQARVVTLVGAGGVGKTRLALAAGARLLAGGGDGTWLVELASLRDPELAAGVIAKVLGVVQQSGQPVLESLVDAVGERSLSLVLDNCEHLADTVAELVAVLTRRCTGVAVLATSREPLRVTGERVYRVEPLSLPEVYEDDRLERLADSEAVRLFVERAREHWTAFKLDEGNAVSVAAVVRRLDGIPLAIELAAARLRSLGIGEMQRRLEQSFGLLTGGPRTALARQQTVRALLAWSFELLSGPERTLLARLAVFAGGFDLDAAEAVCAGGAVDQIDVLDLLAALVDKSLVHVEEREEQLRYRLLQTVREYAPGELAPPGTPKREGVRQAHRDHYLALAEQADTQLMGQDQLAWLDRLEVEHDNFRAALTYCLEEPNPEPGLRLATALRRFRQVRGYGAEAAKALQDQLQRPQTSEPTLARARALTALGLCISYVGGDLRQVETCCEQALAIARAHSDDHVAAEVMRVLGWTWLRAGRVSEATELLREGVALAREIGDTHLLARLLDAQGATLTSAGAGARESLQEAILLHRQAGDYLSVARVLSSLGIAALAAGEFDDARNHLQEAVQVAGDLGVTDIGHTSIMLGLATYLGGDYALAHAVFTDALRVARDREKYAVPLALFGLALSTSPTDPEQAAQLHGAVDALLSRSGGRLDMLGIRMRAEDHARLRALLGDARFEEAYELGRAQPTDEIIKELVER